MDKTTKLKAIENNRLITSYIGYPEKTMNDTFLKNEFLHYSHKKDDFFSFKTMKSNLNIPGSFEVYKHISSRISDSGQLVEYEMVLKY